MVKCLEPPASRAFLFGGEQPMEDRLDMRIHRFEQSDFLRRKVTLLCRAPNRNLRSHAVTPPIERDGEMMPPEGFEKFFKKRRAPQLALVRNHIRQPVDFDLLRLREDEARGHVHLPPVLKPLRRPLGVGRREDFRCLPGGLEVEEVEIDDQRVIGNRRAQQGLQRRPKLRNVVSRVQP